MRAMALLLGAIIAQLFRVVKNCESCDRVSACRIMPTSIQTRVRAKYDKLIIRREQDTILDKIHEIRRKIDEEIKDTTSAERTA